MEDKAFDEWAEKELADFIHNKFFDKVRPIMLASWQAATARQLQAEQPVNQGLVEALKALVNAKEMKENGYSGYPAAKLRAWEMAKQALAAAESQAQGGWLDIKDNYYSNFGAYQPPTHYMPLPNPPAKEQQP